MENGANNQNTHEVPSPQTVLQDQLQIQSQPETENFANPLSSNEPKSKVKVKVLIAGLIFLLIVVVIGTGYFYLQNQKSKTQTPATSETQESPTSTLDPTTNWETYTSNVQGFKIEYPSSWTLTEKETPISQVVLKTNIDSGYASATSTIPYQITIYEVGNDTGGGVMDYLKTINQQIFLENLEIEELKIGTHRVYKFNLSPGEYPQRYYYIPKTPNQDEYIIFEVIPDLDWPGENNETMIENVNTIISSLQFIDSN